MNDVAVFNRPSVERQLRDRIEELEEELRQAKEAVWPSDKLPVEWKLQPATHKLVISLYKASGGYLSHDQLYHAVRTYSEECDPKLIVAQQVMRARQKLEPFGIEIKSRWGSGYELPVASRAIIKAAIEQRLSA